MSDNYENYSDEYTYNVDRSQDDDHIEQNTDENYFIEDYYDQTDEDIINYEDIDDYHEGESSNETDVNYEINNDSEIIDDVDYLIEEEINHNDSLRKLYEKDIYKPMLDNLNKRSLSLEESTNLINIIDNQMRDITFINGIRSEIGILNILPIDITNNIISKIDKPITLLIFEWTMNPIYREYYNEGGFMCNFNNSTIKPLSYPTKNKLLNCF
jgi:hypothetical protein